MQLAQRILEYLGDDAVDRLRRYYTHYSGRAFDTLAGGGDRPDTRNAFTADDIVAVSCLSIQMPPKASITLLQDTAISALLDVSLPDGNPALPVGVDLWDADRRVVESGSPADQLWHRLLAIDGIQWVTAGKLMARKRPQLIPVFDNVVKAALMPSRSDHWWVSLWDASQERAIPDRLQALKTAAAVPNVVPLLRVLDVAVWMTSQE